MTGAVRAAHRTPTLTAPAGTHAAGTDRTDTARAGAVHPVPKSFRSKERQS
ncbi:hypothetical protein SAMN02787144_104120 [Streptomyces atratus]|uniref:Uncharacterized protein n=1 Tax=Streptomyces atratus TaxID=1893 RepID=A0A1K2F9X0_STRAR|nr:hypothetical protein SAMN02787144_104120 [Streptomyces atratus]